MIQENTEVRYGHQLAYDRIYAYSKTLEIIDKYAEQEPKTVCDLCVYETPSSSDGKPCTMCPAETKRGE